MSAIYKEPLSILKRLLFVAMIVLGMTIATSTVDAARIISGTVYNDTDGNANANTISSGAAFKVGGGTIALYNGATEIATAPINANGTYSITAPTGTSFTLRVKAPASGYVAGPDVSITQLDNSDQPNRNIFVRGIAGSINGKVFNDAISGTTPPNGVYDAGEILLSGVTIVLKKNGTQISQTTSDSTNGYSFKNLPALSGTDKYTLEIISSGLPSTVGFVTSSDGTALAPKKDITLTSVSGSVVNKNFAASDLNLNGILGSVYNDVNDNGSYASTEDLLLPGTVVTLYYGDGTTLVPNFSPVTTPAAANYKFQPLPMGTYVVKVAPFTGYVAKISSLTVQVAGTGSYAGQDLSFTASTTSPTGINITGSVFAELQDSITVNGPDSGGTGNNVRDGAYENMPGVSVSIYKDSTPGTPYLTQQTKSDGTYSFLGIPAGKYIIKIPTTDPSGFYFINDSDGKSTNPAAPHGGTRAPYEVKTEGLAGAKITERNFWFGKTAGFIRYGALTGDRQYWGSNVHGVTSAGWVTPVKFNVFEEDGVTPARDYGGALIPTLNYTAVGTNKQWFVLSNIKRGLYVFKPVAGSYDTSLAPVSLNTTIDGWLLRNDSTNGTFMYFNGDRSISGKVYVDKDITDGFTYKATDVPAYKTRIRIYNLTKGYEGAYWGIDTNGDFSINNLPAAKYRVTVDALTNMDQGYGDQVEYYRDYKGANTLGYYEIDLSGATTSLTGGDILLKLKSTTHKVTGRVHVDFSGQGVIIDYPNSGTNTYPLRTHHFGGATVHLLDANNQPVLDGSNNPITTTLDKGITDQAQQSGLFSFDNLAANTTYRIKVVPTDTTLTASIAAYPDTKEFTTGATVDLIPRLDFLFRGKTSLISRVYSDQNGSGSPTSQPRDPGGSPSLYLDRWDATANAGAGDWINLQGRSWVSDTGFYYLPKGKYRLRAGAGEGATAGITIADTDTTSPVNSFIYDVTASTSGNVEGHFSAAWGTASGLTGKVYIDSNGNGLIDSNDQLMADTTGIKIETYYVPNFLPTYNTAADIIAAASSPRQTTTVAANGEYLIPTAKMTRNFVRLDSSTLPAGYEVINNSNNSKPTHANTPATFKEFDVIEVAIPNVGKSNQNFLVKRNVTSEISGYVLFDIDYDEELQSPGDKALASTIVVLKSGGVEKNRAIVGADGYYGFAGLPNGTYTVELLENGAIPSGMVHAPASIAKSRTYTVTNSGLIARDQNFFYNQPGVKGIAGQVVVDINNNGLVDSNDIKMAGVTVTLTNATGTPINLGDPALNPVTTGSAGTYQFISLPAGSYKVVISGTPLNDYNVYKTATGNTTLKEIAVTLASTDSMKANQYFLLAGKSNNSPGSGPGTAANASGISGFLYKGATGNEVGVPAGNFYPNRQINLYDSADKFITRTYTDTNGKYQFYNLPLGNFKVKAEDIPSGLALSTPEEKNLTVPVGGLHKQNYWLAEISPNGVKFEVKYNANHSGTTSSLDVLVPGIIVELWLPGGTSALYSDTTDANGAVEFKNIGALTYNVRFNAANLSGKGYQGLTAAYNLSIPQAGAPTQLLLVDGLRNLSGKLQKDTDGDGTVETPITGIDTTLIWAGPNDILGDADDVKFGSVAAAGSVTTVAGKTDGTGQYIYSKLPNGKYRVAYNTADTAFDGLALIAATGNTAPPRDVLGVTADKNDIHFNYEPLASLEGYVRYDLNGNSVYNDTVGNIDPGIGGVAITLYKEGATPGTYVLVTGKTATTSSTAGSEGYFKIDGLSYGKYYVQIDKTKIPNYKLIWTGQDGTTTNDRIYGTLSSTASTKINWNALYGADPAKTGEVTIETRSDSDGVAGYSTGDMMFGGVPVTVYAKDGANTLFFGTVTTSVATDATLGTSKIKLPYGTYDFKADEGGILTGKATVVYDSDNAPLGAISNKAVNAATDKVYFGYQGVKTGGAAGVKGNVSEGASYLATNPDLNGANIDLFRMISAGSYVWVDRKVSGATGGAGNYDFGITLPAGGYLLTSDWAQTNTAYKIKDGFDNTTLEVKTLSLAASSVTNNLVYELDSTKSRIVTFSTFMDDKLDKKFKDGSTSDSTAAKDIVLQITGSGLVDFELTTNSAGQATKALAFGNYKVKVKDSTAPANDLVVVYNSSGDNLADPASRTMTSFAVTDGGTEVAYFGFQAKPVTPPGGTGKKIEGRVVTLNNGTSYQATDAGKNGTVVELWKNTGAGYAPYGVATTQTIGGIAGTYQFLDQETSKGYEVRIQSNPPAGTLTIPAIGKHSGTLTTDITNWHFGYSTSGLPNTQTITVKTYNDDGAIPGALDNSGANQDSPLSSVTLSLVSSDNSYVSAPGIVTASGAYTFNNVPHGNYTLTATTPSGLSNAFESDSTTNGSITLTVDGTPLDPYFGYKANVPSGSYQISGIVVRETQAPFGSYNSTSPDPTDLPMSGITLTLATETTTGNYTLTSRTVTTDSTGKYTFGLGTASDPGLGDGKYQVVITGGLPTTVIPTFDADGSIAGTSKNIVHVEISGANKIDQNFGYQGDPGQPNQVKDLIIETKRDDGDTTYQTTDPFEANVSLTITGPAGTNFPAGITTGAGGTITFTGMPVGTYTIVATTPLGRDIVYNSSGNTTNTVTIDTTATAPGVAGKGYFGYKINTTGTGEISGRVVNRNTAASPSYVGDELGIGGVTVTLDVSFDNGTTWDNGVEATITNASGSYTFGTLANNTYRVNVDNTNTNISARDPYYDKDGVATAHHITGALAVGETKSDWHFVYDAKSTSKSAIQLRTRFDSDGNNAYNAVAPFDAVEGGVTVNIAGMGISANVITDSTSGDLLIPNLPVGTYTLTVTVPRTGLDMAYGPSGAATVGSVTTTNGSTSDGNFGFKIKVTPGATGNISGYAVIDTNANNAFDNGPAPAHKDAGINQAEIKVEFETGPNVWNEWGNPAIRAKTDTAGYYTLTGLPVGNWRVSVVNTGGTTGISPTFVRTNTPATAATFDTTLTTTGASDWNFGYKMSSPTNLTVNVRFDSNFDGTSTGTEGDGKDPMLTGTPVTMTVNGNGISQTFTSDGTAKILNNMPYGAYTITVNRGGTNYDVAYNTAGTTTDAGSFTSSAGNTSADFGIKLKTDPGATGRTITGRTILDSDTTYLGSESGLNGLAVAIYQQNGAAWHPIKPATTTTGNGDFSFNELPSGQTYKVVVTSGMTAQYTKAGIAPESTSITEISKVVSADETWIYAYAGQYYLEGTVSFDTDRSQTYKNGLDIDMQGVTVKAVKMIGSSLVTITAPVTGPNGRYKIEGLTAGDWTVSIDSFGTIYPGPYDYSYVDTNKNGLDSNGDSTNTNTSYVGTVGPALPNVDHNFGLYGNGRIEGKMLVDTNGSGVYDTADETVVLTAPSYIRVTDQTGNPNFVPYYVKTKSDGSYTIKYLIPGFSYEFEGKIGNVPSGITPFNVPANYTKVSYYADQSTGSNSPSMTTNGSGALVAQRTIPSAGTFIYTTSRIGFRSTSLVDGRLILDVNLNGVYDPAIDVMLDGGNITATANDSSAGISPVSTTSGSSPILGDPSGYYQFPGLPGSIIGDGKWNIQANPTVIANQAGLQVAFESVNDGTVDGRYQADMSTGGKTGVNFGYKGQNTLEGEVLFDDNGDGAIDSSDSPIVGVVVVLKDSRGNAVATTTTDSTGKYTFAGLSKWNSSGADYAVSIDFNQPALSGASHILGGNTSLTSGNVYKDNIILTDNNSAQTVAAPNGGFLARSSNVISGYVYLDANANGIREATENAVPTATHVTLTRVSDGVILQTVPIGADGSYSFTGVAKTNYTIDVAPAPSTFFKAHSDPDGVTTPHTATINLTASQANMNFGYINSGSITVRVSEASGATYLPTDPGILGAEVIILDATGVTEITRGTADSNGKVTFANLDASVNYTVKVEYGITTAGTGKVLAQSEWIDGGTITGTNDDGYTTKTAAVSIAPHTVDESVLYFAFRTNNNPVTIHKAALKDSAHIGEFVPYAVKIKNNSGTDPVLNMSLSDMIPAGFKYVRGSGRLTINGVTTKVDPVGTRPIEFKGINLAAGGEAKITYILVVGAGVTPGDYVNKAQGRNAAGFANSNMSSATVKVTGDPLFDDSLIFGKVFHDKNRNGRQDKDEPGVGGVKLVTARGDIITTDEHGRYHLADVSGGRWERGTNFILKLDTRSLPQGLTTTTENPIVVRLSPGLPSRINFGVEVPPPVAARLAEQLALAKAEEIKHIEEKLQKEEKFVVESIHFAFDRDQIEPEFENTLDSLAEVLRLHPEWKIRIEGHTDSLGTETYNKDLSQRRANAVKTYLLKTGVNSAQLVDAVGLGLSEPVADNGTPEGRYKNRRVEFKLEK